VSEQQRHDLARLEREINKLSQVTVLSLVISSDLLFQGDSKKNITFECYVTNKLCACFNVVVIHNLIFSIIYVKRT